MKRKFKAKLRSDDGKGLFVEVPGELGKAPELAAALKKNEKAQAAWSKLAYTHQKEHAAAILDAKKPETRARRIAKAIEMLVAPAHRRPAG